MNDVVLRALELLNKRIDIANERINLTQKSVVEMSEQFLNMLKEIQDCLEKAIKND